EMKVFGLTIDPFTNAPIVILKDMDEKNALPVWIGVLESSAIAAELEKIQFSRPMTHDLVREILKTMQIDVTKIEVNDLKDNVYYATIHMASKGTAFTVDARPSDAIALALRMSSPIFVDTRVLDKSKSIDMRAEGKQGSAKDLIEMLDQLSPDEFGKYKM
ncbi:MAG: bifunctional nuclease family protein, partial [Deltaproteobacteria bacterium]|nr:bifunctional nuclease family protein [Deltaproteobacteria bacterium]